MEHAPKLIKIDGEWTYVSLTDEEIAEREAITAQFLKERAEQAEKAAKAKAAAEAARAKLAKLGLTDAEIDALLP